MVLEGTIGKNKVELDTINILFSREQLKKMNESYPKEKNVEFFIKKISDEKITVSC